VLIAEETEEEIVAPESAHQIAKAGAAFEEKAAGVVAKFLKKTSEAGIVKAAERAGALITGQEGTEADVQFEVSKMTNGADAVFTRSGGEFFGAEYFAAGQDGFFVHGGSFNGATVILAEPTKMFTDDGADFFGRFFRECVLEIFASDRAMAGVDDVSKGAGCAPDPRNRFERECLKRQDEGFYKPVEERLH